MDSQSFFTRTEDKYGLQELNINKINIGFSFDYEILMIPPIFADKGTFSFSCEDVSLNAVWMITLNKFQNFFNLEMSHILFQVDTDNFEIEVDNYSDLT